MSRGAVWIALLFAASCKQEPPKGALPPVTPPGSTTAPAPASPPAAAQGSDSPHGRAAEKTAPKALEMQSDGRLAMGPFTLVAPPGWTAKPVTSSMRAASFVIPLKAGGTSELVVTYFGRNGAGSVDENIDRWLGQIAQPDGKSSREAAKIEKLQLAGQDATVMSVTGHFAAPAMPGGGPVVDKPDQSMLAAIVSSAQGPYYFKLVVDKAALAETDPAFRALLASLKLK